MHLISDFLCLCTHIIIIIERMDHPEKEVLVTVGTTEFDSLIEYASSDDFL